MSEVKFKKELFDLVNSLTPITNSIIIENKDDNILISRKNASSTIAYKLTAPKDAMTFDGDNIAFYDFNEFNSLLNVFESPDITIDANKMVISQNQSKLKYILSDIETITPGPKTINFPESEVTFKLAAIEIQAIKKMVNLIKAKYVTFKITDNVVNVNLFSEGHDNSYDKNFEINNVNGKSFEIKISVEVFEKIPLNEYNIDIVQGVMKIGYSSNGMELNIFVAECE
jgi:hypothetical protein